MIFGHSIEIWIASLLAVAVRIKYSKGKSRFLILMSVLIALGAGLILYGPIVAILGLTASWNVPVAIIIALTAERIV